MMTRACCDIVLAAAYPHNGSDGSGAVLRDREDRRLRDDNSVRSPCARTSEPFIDVPPR